MIGSSRAALSSFTDVGAADVQTRCMTTQTPPPLARPQSLAELEAAHLLELEAVDHQTFRTTRPGG